ncbi:MAG: SHOCT domain-containing protein [Actinomycetota bacterium]|nr:SHOCT domain-containing protein [Actinomycetota bacterium]
MPLASGTSSYPLLNVFWTIFEVFLFVVWFWLVITVFVDIFRSSDLSGLAKAMWVLFVFFIPLFGVLAYLIVRGAKMQERQTRRQEQAFLNHSFDGSAASPSSTTDQLAKLAALRDSGVVSAEEFQREKAKILS